MKFLLVIQCPATSMKDYDDMIKIESLLIEGLSATNEVDGRDIGANEVNIFIYTDNPLRAFEEVKSVLAGCANWFNAQVAYRDISTIEYTILWPKDLKIFKVG